MLSVLCRLGANYLLSLWLQAASRHQCLYLVRLHAQEFLLQGGDAQWLRGLDYAPQKLRNLCEVITILAHKPWLIKTEHIEVGIEGVCVCELQRWNGIQDVASSIKPFKDIYIYEHFMSDCNFNVAIFLTGHKTPTYPLTYLITRKVKASVVQVSLGENLYSHIVYNYVYAYWFSYLYTY